LINKKRIQEIPEIPEGIKDASGKGRLVIFIGAGASRIVGCPSWEDFAHIYLKYIKSKGLINYFDYKQLKSLAARKVISICKKIIKSNGFPLPDISKVLQPDVELEKKYNIYESIYQFKAIYITTNYDDLLDKVVLSKKAAIELAEEESSASKPDNNIDIGKIIYNYDELLTSKLKNGMVLHIHGSVKKPDKIIATLVDYIKHYERDSKPEVLLKEIFNSYTVLFIGYGLEELEIIEYLIQKQTSINNRLIKHFILQPFYSNDYKLFEFHSNYYSDLGEQ